MDVDETPHVCGTCGSVGATSSAISDSSTPPVPPSQGTAPSSPAHSPIPSDVIGSAEADPEEPTNADGDAPAPKKRKRTVVTKKEKEKAFLDLMEEKHKMMEEKYENRHNELKSAVDLLNSRAQDLQQLRDHFGHILAPKAENVAEATVAQVSQLEDTSARSIPQYSLPPPLPLASKSVQF